MPKLTDAMIPGVPAPEPPSMEEPTTPRGPLPPKPEQGAPERRTPTGYDTGAPQTAPSQQGAYQTTALGVRVPDTDHSLRVGTRGPTLLNDHHLREKITHFDHERIPERVVHARGAGAHGTFKAYGSASSVCKAAFLAKGAETPVFVRFSTVLGSRGSADTVRDTRGFATKFYTSEGNYDLVANNIPVFFIQDGIKFPDIIHAAKPHPDREIPQAQSAHDTFWDFVSLHTEATHHTLWNMSDRGIPRSYRTMEGFGVNTFRLVNQAGETSLVKFHWKPLLGVHSLVWEEAQMLAGVDPDYHRRDLYDAIESGAFPQWELGVQVMPDNPDQTFEGIDLLDPTKLVPEELAPVQRVGMLTLDRTPTNFFAESEQVAFCTSHVVPGIDFTDDPLLAARNFSYLDTQLTRLGGPNFVQIPINRPHVDVNDNHRDGYQQQAVHGGVAPYKPNSMDGGNPFLAPAEDSVLTEVPVVVTAGTKGRVAPASYADHYSQAQMFYASMTPVEKLHIADAYTFELSRVYEQTIKERSLRVIAEIDPTLCATVAAGLGLPAPTPNEPATEVTPSPALSQLGGTYPPEGRLIGIVVDVDDEDSLSGLEKIRAALLAAKVVPLVIAAHGGELGKGLIAQRTFPAVRSVEVDAVLISGCPGRPQMSAGGPDANPAPPAGLDPRVALLLQEAFRHGKSIGAWGGGTTALELAMVPADAPGMTTGTSATTVLEGVLSDLAGHRAWERFLPLSA